MPDLPYEWDFDVLEMQAMQGEEPTYAARALVDSIEFYHDMRLGHTPETALHLAVNYLRRKRPALTYFEAIDLLHESSLLPPIHGVPS